MTPRIALHQATPSEAERVGRLADGLLAELYPGTEFKASKKSDFGWISTVETDTVSSPRRGITP